MRCPACQSVNHSVIDSRMATPFIHRRRRCNLSACGVTFTTLEIIAVTSKGPKKTAMDRQIRKAAANLYDYLEQSE